MIVRVECVIAQYGRDKMNKILLFKKFKNLSNEEKLVYLNQGALFTDLNVLIAVTNILIIWLIIFGII